MSYVDQCFQLLYVTEPTMYMVCCVQTSLVYQNIPFLNNYSTSGSIRK